MDWTGAQYLSPSQREDIIKYINNKIEEHNEAMRQ